MTDHLEATAYHEAGHAVVRWVQHRRCEDLIEMHVSIREREDTAGRVSEPDFLSRFEEMTEDGSELSWTMDDVEREIVALYAGRAAGELVNAPEVAAEGCGRDDSDALALAGYLREWTPSREAALRQEAHELVFQHRYLIEALAEELLGREELDGEEVDWILRIAEGNHARESLESYRRLSRG